MSQQVIVGTIGRAHGLRGDLLVRPRTDMVEERFAAGKPVRAGDRELTIASHSWQTDRLVVHFVGIDDRSSAEGLRGLDLWAEGIGEVSGPEEYHDLDLIGLAVQDAAGARLGDVVAVQHHPAQDLLVIGTEAGERLVPFVTELVPEVDLAAGFLQVNPIPGLLREVPDAD